MKTNVFATNPARFNHYFTEAFRRTWGDPLRQESVCAEVEEACRILTANAPPWVDRREPIYLSVNPEGGTFGLVSYLTTVDTDMPATITARRTITAKSGEHTPLNTFQLDVATTPRSLMNLIRFRPLNWAFLWGVVAGIGAHMAVQVVARLVAGG